MPNETTTAPPTRSSSPRINTGDCSRPNETPIERRWRAVAGTRRRQSQRAQSLGNRRGRAAEDLGRETQSWTGGGISRGETRRRHATLRPSRRSRRGRERVRIGSESGSESGVVSPPPSAIHATTTPRAAAVAEADARAVALASKQDAERRWRRRREIDAYVSREYAEADAWLPCAATSALAVALTVVATPVGDSPRGDAARDWRWRRRDRRARVGVWKRLVTTRRCSAIARRRRRWRRTRRSRAEAARHRVRRVRRRAASRHGGGRDAREPSKDVGGERRVAQG